MRSPFVFEIHSIALFPIAFNEVIFNDLIALVKPKYGILVSSWCNSLSGFQVYYILFWSVCTLWNRKRSKENSNLVCVQAVVTLTHAILTSKPKCCETLFSTQMQYILFSETCTAPSVLSAVFLWHFFCAISIVVQKESRVPDSTGRAYLWLIFFTIMRFIASLCHHSSKI